MPTIVIRYLLSVLVETKNKLSSIKILQNSNIFFRDFFPLMLDSQLFYFNDNIRIFAVFRLDFFF